jgi:O-methyltransferase
MLKRWILNAVHSFGYEIFKTPEATRNEHEAIIPLASYSPWNLDTGFAETYELCLKHTLVDIYRCYEIWSLVAEAAKLHEGDLLEVGVWRGGTGALIAAQSAKLIPSATVLLCDTFSGVVKTGDQDTIYKDGMHADTSEEIVKDLLNSLRLSNALVFKGIFPEQTAEPIQDRRFRFCHIDVDVYASSKGVCEWLWPRLLPGGVVVFDDYGMRGTEGVQRFVNEWRHRDDLNFLYNLNGHAVFIKK